ncbi:hypothetical protein HOC01_03755 [archaeon]|jgi:hypothetical protein|nr:hypothetical protein [archaeon]MBT6698473.1 hypothetical protein [archaeon]
MVVCISASIKFKKEIEEVARILDELKIPYLLPVMDLPKELETPDMIPKLVADHFEKIDKSKSLLVVNPTGYFGNSVKVEIGYAKGVGKKIYFLEKTNQPELDCLADDFISINELHKLNL